MNDTAEIIYTSGTTGDPKGCVLTNYNVFLVAMMAAATFGFDIKTRTLHAMPLYHSAPLNLMMFGTMLTGGTHILLREYHPQFFLDTIEKYKVTHTFAAPIAILMPLQLPNFSSYNLTSMKLWVYGGGPISRENAKLIIEKYKTEKFMQVYGLSEAGPNGSYLLPEDQVRKAGSIGFCGTMNAHLRVVNEKGENVKVNEVGEIIIRSETNMKEYYKNPTATSKTIVNGWIYTGDLAKRDEDNYIYIVDRKKDMIISGGENIYTKEVEDALQKHPAILLAAVFGIPHPQWGETVAAAIVLKQNSNVTSNEITEFLQDKISKYKIPKIIKFYTNLPLTPTGKVIKYHLKKDFIN
ncbi:MAG: AMP-binding protein [Stygiobacter sp.]